MGSRGWVEASYRRWPIALAASLAFLAGTRGSNASEPGYEILVGVGESDNVARLPSGGKRDTIGMEGLDFTWHDQRPRLNTDIDAELQHLNYFNHTFRDEVIGNFLGQARATLVSQLLFWDVADNFGQGRTDPLAAITPANRENINYFSTGPDLTLPLAADTLFNVTARYGNVNYQTSPLNSTRVTGGVGVLHKLSTDTSVSLNVRDERVRYSDSLLNPGYDREEAYVRYDAKGARTTVAVDLGYSKLRGSVSPVGSVLARLEVSRRVSASSTVAATLGREYSDSANSFQLVQTLGGANLNTTSGTQTGAPFVSNHGSLAWNFQRRRTGFAITVEQFKDQYQRPTNLDDTRTQIYANASRLLTPTLTLGLSELYLHEIFNDIAGTFTETTTDLQLTWRAARRISFAASFDRATRHTDIPNSGFTENRLWLRVGYGRPAQVPPGPPMPPLPGRSQYY